MPLETVRNYVCDSPLCPGDGVKTPAETDVVNGEPMTAGWITFSGTAHVGGSSQSSTNYFHSVGCATAWFANVVAPGLTAMGAP